MVSLRNENDGSVSIRYLRERPCNAGSVAATPRLEDLYLWMFPQGSTGDGKPVSRYQ